MYKANTVLYMVTNSFKIKDPSPAVFQFRFFVLNSTKRNKASAMKSFSN